LGLANPLTLVSLHPRVAAYDYVFWREEVILPDAEWCRSL
jgi:hypothetical protein